MRPIRKVVVSTLAASALGASLAPIASAQVIVESPTAFTPANATLISDWWWLRTTSASATWTFSADGVRSARTSTVYLQFAPLVTNGVNGGSGYARSIKVIIRGTSAVPSIVRTSTTFASLYNPFRPRLTEDTRGIGYQTYGYASVFSSIWRPSPLPPKAATIYSPKYIAVTIQWTTGYHVAVNRDAVHLVYATP